MARPHIPDQRWTDQWHDEDEDERKPADEWGYEPTEDEREEHDARRRT